MVQGEAEVQAQLSVRGNAAIIGDTRHEQSWQKIQEMEAPRGPGEEAPTPKYGPPKFVRPLNSLDNVIEGQPGYFEAQVCVALFSIIKVFSVYSIQRSLHDCSMVSEWKAAGCIQSSYPEKRLWSRHAESAVRFGRRLRRVHCGCQEPGRRGPNIGNFELFWTPIYSERYHA